MERIKPLELGALPWSRDDIRRIMFCILDSLGASRYRPEIGLWNHRTCNGWNIQLHRQHFNVSRSETAARMDLAVQKTCILISELLKRRLQECRTSLEILTTCGAATAEEQDDKIRLLFEFWAVSRALEQKP